MSFLYYRFVTPIIMQHQWNFLKYKNIQRLLFGNYPHIIYKKKSTQTPVQLHIYMCIYIARICLSSDPKKVSFVSLFLHCETKLHNEDIPENRFQ